MSRVGVYAYDATIRQKAAITKWCMILGITEPVEEKPMSMGVAGELIRKLAAQAKEAKSEDY